MNPFLLRKEETKAGGPSPFQGEGKTKGFIKGGKQDISLALRNGTLRTLYREKEPFKGEGRIHSFINKKKNNI